MATTSGTGVQAFLGLRDRLFALRSDQPTATQEFRWPELGEFNWALDYFDALPANQTALRLVNADGPDDVATFGNLKDRSNRVANFLRARASGAATASCSCLPNCVPLWETMLAAMKLGAVVIPATTLLTPDDLRDRIERGQVAARGRRGRARAQASRTCPAPASIAVGERAAGWHDYADVDRASADFAPDGADAGRAIRCCSTSPPAPRRARSWSSTPTPATRSGTCRPCTGSGCSPATCT